MVLYVSLVPYVVALGFAVNIIRDGVRFRNKPEPVHKLAFQHFVIAVAMIATVALGLTWIKWPWRLLFPK
jgi:hypothetical protein